jgi:membrane-bound metal-dependent hydrolase YbcI (DUF457 family)
MNTEAHLALGWVLAHAGGAREGRGFRAAITIAALAPDLDALSYAFGPRAYSNWHHAAGHNIFFSFASSAACVWFCRRSSAWWKVLAFSQLAFYSHFFGDYFFTRFPLEFFWPVSHRGYIYSYRIGLDHPINLVFGYASFLLFVAYGMIYQRTPIEIISVELDRRIVNLFRRRRLSCHVCGRGAVEICSRCGRAACLRHGRIGRGFRVMCSACAIAASTAAAAQEATRAGGRNRDRAVADFR